jgi:hypothetical protein
MAFENSLVFLMPSLREKALAGPTATNSPMPFPTTVIQIEGASYRLREHADLVPENIRPKSLIQPSPIPPTLKRRSRPPKNGALDQHEG